jgi:type IV pilus biogenesis protein CpaD/CtpE
MRSLFALMFVCAALVVAGCADTDTTNGTAPPATTEPAPPAETPAEDATETAPGETP